MNKIAFYIILISIGIFSSCSPATRLERQSDAELKGLLKKRVAPNKHRNVSFERMKIDMKGGLDISGNGKLYIDNNNFIYFTAQIIGLEVARLLVTRDSIFYINRIERKYLFISMKDVQKMYSKRIDYFLLQNFLLNGLVLPGRYNARHLARFIKREGDNYFFRLGSGNERIALTYDEKMILKKIELNSLGSEIFLNAVLNFTNESISFIESESVIKGARIVAKISPGRISDKIIPKPSMNITNRYSEISK